MIFSLYLRFRGKLRQANMGPILECGGEDVTRWGTGQGLGVRNSFTFKGIGINNPFMLYKKVNDWMYGSIVYNSMSTWTCSSKVIDGLTVNGVAKLWTLNDGSSPYLGQSGIAFEFHACNGSGERSPRSNRMVITKFGYRTRYCQGNQHEILYRK